MAIGKGFWPGSSILTCMTILLGLLLLMPQLQAMFGDEWYWFLLTQPSFNQITVDGWRYQARNDVVITLASGLPGTDKISCLNSSEANHLWRCLDMML
ncbi:PREDICTED: arginine biosynthesis bifunctional protein ArgJ, chloroplastic-like [Ipomoea nil]|uniref:arginine biosynthesis bifunctional protein ArgJ, chloroplastic-like n=1 Tax=Ipomoea nil TaxID=35883 RepID=UPI000901567C|nr:PREDICTED: arginine biosynthesis bifunctional protein ArgJ, chloroplastic-like [Ipomoea nil]